MAVNFCPNCGATNTITQKPVPKTMTEIYAETEAKVQTQVTPKNSPPQPQTSNTTSAQIALARLGAIAFLVGASGFMITANKDKTSVEEQLDELRELKFKFVNNVTADELYSKLQPALTAKYGNKFEFDRQDEVISVICGRTIYEIILNDDATFSIWWRQNVKNALKTTFFSWKPSEIDFCREVRTDTAIIAYELQRQFEIN